MAKTAAEKRRYYRFAMSYPVKLFDRGGRQLTMGKTLDLSRGGALLSLPQATFDDLGIGGSVNVSVSLPPESYRAETATDFACEARVVRRTQTSSRAGNIAVEFARPMQIVN
jgi:hypothetical protein